MARISFDDEGKKVKKLLRGESRELKILDVGCGFGRNLELLQNDGFQNVVGVDINTELVKAARAKGLKAYDLNSFSENFQEQSFDLLVFSHIVEHLAYQDLKTFIENYAKYLRTGGKILIVTPVLQHSFYNDFDHVKPYYPISFATVFTRDVEQVQIQSSLALQREKLFFFKGQWRLRYFSSLYNEQSFSLPRYINMLLKLLYVSSRGLCGEVLGWMAIYKKI
jgi:2-polyprenyl-3-methyl-5-hydroxy-6-metoxy-1,4-benzoquinol methylase